jgi:hypothetical protein
MRHVSSVFTLLLVTILFNSCAFFNKINDKIFPYRFTIVEDLTQAPALKPKASVRAPNEKDAKRKNMSSLA